MNSKKIKAMEKLSRLIGTYPLKFMERKMKIHKLWLFFSINITILLIVGTLLLLISFIDLADGLLLYSTIIGGLFSPIVCFLTLLIGVISNRSVMTEYIEKIKLADHRLSMLGFRKTSKHSFKDVAFFTALHSVTLLMNDNLKISLTSLMIMSYYALLSTAFSFRICLISAYIDDLGARFQSITNHLQSVKINLNNEGNILKLIELSRAHGCMCSASKMLNQMFSSQMLLIIFHCFISFIQNTFLLLSTWEITFISQLNRFIWCIFYFFLPWRLAHSCWKSRVKAKEFNNQLYQQMIEDKSNEILNNQKLRLHISMNQEIVFTACGLFPIENSMVFSMVASGTCYLVILLQFNELSPSKSYRNSIE